MAKTPFFVTQMTKSGLPKSAKKFIRLQKALIGKQFLDFKKREELVNELYQKIRINKRTKEPKNEGNKELKNKKTKKQKVENKNIRIENSAKVLKKHEI